MRDLVLSLPSQLSDGYERGSRLAPVASDEVDDLVVVGMGGSGIAGDLLGGLAASESRCFVHVVRGPELPRAVGPMAAVVLISYSGTTWETLAAYDQAGAKGAPRAVMASGGELLQRAQKDGVPFLEIPPGLPPRSAVGYLFGGLLALADPLFPESNAARLSHAVERLARARPRLVSATGVPSNLARRAGRREPLVYAEASFGGLARRWKTQVEENAKRLAHFDVLPELFHNALVPWDAISRAEAARRFVVLLEWSGQDAQLAGRFSYLARLFAVRGVPCAKVPLASSDRLEALLLGLWTGDLFSLALAKAAGVDPFGVAAIETMKRRLKGR